ncbi:MAG: fatty acid desaturase [Bacteriovoracaceae bacterium]|nr:fatty acid desaturase [Bacteriovoracaceae bacterium]
MEHSFSYTKNPNPHVKRSREMIKKYPELRKLIGPYQRSALYIFLMVGTMLGIAYWCKSLSWPIIFLLSYTVGALIDHALFAMMHESAHNLVFKSARANKIMGIICNIPQGLPSAIGFRTYHLIHHSNMGEEDYDADLAFNCEAKLISNSWWRKCLWFVVFMIIEAIRPMKLKGGSLKDPWVVLNIIFILGVDAAIFFFVGWKAFAFLLLSSFFSVGLHPVGARWIQEHFTFKEGQETYSYYGPYNKIQFNIGYHNEHHDFFRVPWINLPKLRAIAPEYYDNLYYHTSWTKLFFQFIFDKKLSLFSRIVRQIDMKITNEELIENIDPLSGTYIWNTEKSEDQVYS